MLLRKIESLRKEPKSVRNRYAFGIALVTTMLVATVWSVSLPARLSFNNMDTTGGETNGADPGADINAQFSQLRELVGQSLSDIRAQAELIDAATSTDPVSAAPTSTSTTTTAVQPFGFEPINPTPVLIATSAATTTATSAGLVR